MCSMVIWTQLSRRGCTNNWMRASRSTVPARRALFALLVLLLLLIAPPGFAPAAHAQPTVEFTSTTMTVNFPDRLTFTMTAIGDDIVTAEVYWRPSGSTATS